MQELRSLWFGLNWWQKTLFSLAIAAILLATVWFVFDPFPGTGKDSEEPEAEQPAEIDRIELTEAQQKAVDDYGEEELDAIARLKNGLWSTLDESSQVTFSDRTFSIDGESPRPYAVAALKETTQNPQAGSYTVDYIMAVLTDEGTGIMILHRSPGSETVKDALEWTEQPKKIYLEYGLATVVEIKGNIAELEKMVGKEELEKIEKQVKADAAEYFPTATAAEWSGKADVDWDEGVLKTTFKLDNANSTVMDFEMPLGTTANGSDGE